MVRDVRAYLWDMQEACERISRYTRVATLDVYMVDDQLRSAVERQLGILGEALNKPFKIRPDAGQPNPRSSADNRLSKCLGAWLHDA